MYLYSVTEDKGANPSLSYDTNENLVLVARTEDEEGNVQFRSWVGVPDPDAGEASVDVGPAADESTSGGEETSGSASSGQESVTLDEETEPSSEGEELPGMDEYLSDRVVFTNSYPLPFSVKVEWEIDSEQRWKPGSVTLVLQHKVKVQENAEQTQGQEQQDAQGTQEAFLRAVADHAVRHIGEDIVDAALVFIDRHDLVSHFIEFPGAVSSESSHSDNKDAFHSELLSEITSPITARDHRPGL